MKAEETGSSVSSENGAVAIMKVLARLDWGVGGMGWTGPE